MTTFPNSPSPGDQVVFNETTFEWDESRWVALGSISVGPAGPTGPTGPVGDYVETFNGATGAVEGVSSVNGVTGAVSISSFVSGSTGTTTDSIFYDSASSSFINNTNLQLTPTGIPFLTQFGETIYDWGGVTTGATFEIDLSNGMIQHINVGPTGGTGDGSTKTFSFTGENGSLVENVMLVIRGGAGYTMDFTNVTWNDEAGEPAFGVTSGTWTFVPFTYIPIDGLGWVGGAQMTVVQ